MLRGLRIPAALGSLQRQLGEEVCPLKKAELLGFRPHGTWFVWRASLIHALTAAAAEGERAPSTAPSTQGLYLSRIWLLSAHTNGKAAEARCGSVNARRTAGPPYAKRGQDVAQGKLPLSQPDGAGKPPRTKAEEGLV